MEIDSLTNLLKAIKVELAELEAQQKKQLENVLQKQENLLAENALLKGDSKELAMLKEQYSELDEERFQLKLKLDKRIENVNALNASNEMLLNGNEKRDKTIVKYEKQLQKNLKLSSSCDSVLSSQSGTSQQQERRLGCKAIHILSALGAENTAGPWLCLRCGSNDSPINIPSYAEFRQHLMEVHKETIDPALCEHCGWRSTSDRQLQFHMYKKHQIDSLFYTFSRSAILGKDHDYDQQY
ncbi:GH22244 [Drosophila grimshawi]|uniref:GH22244 n=2 Tax=Drosophila grimshawi TaxID=7222 RepID=B4JTJ2_DROGR|nr:GH22244 [Drosophila grimshawi]